MKPADIMFALIKNELFDVDLPENFSMELTEDSFSELYRVSKNQDLAHLICASLERNGLLPENSETASKFRKQQMAAVFRYERMNFEMDRISRALEEGGIPYIPLKGAVIRAYYPEPWMRTSCDIDILVREADLDRAVRLLCLELSYVNNGAEAQNVSLMSSGGVHLELHFRLDIENFIPEEANVLLNDIWENSRSCCGGYKYEMADEWFYLSHIAHIAKHMNSGGIGVRAFLDTYILNTLVDFDSEKRRALLESANLLKFGEVALSLSNKWFSQGKNDDVLEVLEQFVFESATYGNLYNAIAISVAKRGSRSNYILKRLFMPYDMLKHRYPIIIKHRWLTPFCQAARWLGVLKPSIMKRTTRDIKVSMDSWNLKKVEDFFSGIGLEFKRNK